MAKMQTSGAIGTLKQKMNTLKADNDNLRDDNEQLRKQMNQKDNDQLQVSFSNTSCKTEDCLEDPKNFHLD